MSDYNVETEFDHLSDRVKLSVSQNAVESSVVSATSSSSFIPFSNILDAGIGRRRHKMTKLLKGMEEEGAIEIYLDDKASGDDYAVMRFGGKSDPVSAEGNEAIKHGKNSNLVQSSPQERGEADDKSMFAEAVDSLISLAEYDKETKRILRLSLPFTLMAIVEAVLDNVRLIVVGHYMGTDALAAFSVTDVILDLSGEFLNGIIDCHATLCSQAHGAGNNHLAGQYIQILVVLFTVCYIPFIIMWSFLVYHVLIWWDFSEEIAEMGQAYARIAVIGLVVEGWGEAYHGLLEVMDYETYVMFVGIGESVVGAVTICIAVIYMDAQLTTIALIDIVLGIVFLIFNVTFTVQKGWMRPYMEGMFGSIAFKNKQAVRTVAKVALPLCVGTLLASGEWEVLTILAGFMGPAEVATWAIVGSIWDTFEASTEGIGDAAEIRSAYHLGKGNPEMARISSHKSLLLGMIFAFLITSVFFIIGDDIATWFTKDTTLQIMITDLIPLVGIGNITMTFGMICWALVGSQGRYRLATFVSFSSSWCLTMPLASLFTYGLRLDLQGIVAAVIVGYSTTGSILSYILIFSDWDKLSKEVQKVNATTGEIDSSDSEGDDDSSASSISRKSSDSSDDSDSSNSVAENEEKKRIETG
eukprot:scaffold314083_cov51-Attheya_sp.AAC.1